MQQVLWMDPVAQDRADVVAQVYALNGGDEPAHILSAAQIRGNGNTSIFAAFLRKFVGLGF